MILKHTDRPSRRRIRGLAAVAILAAWGGFALTGAAQAKEKSKSSQAKYQATQEDMDRHAKEVYARVGEFPAGDQDGDGQVTKEECWAFVTAMVLLQPETAIASWPTADRDKDGQLTFPEAYEFVRGDHEITASSEKTKKQMDAAMKAGDEALAQKLKLEAAADYFKTWHFILGRRAEIMDTLKQTPDLEFVKKVGAEATKLDSERSAKESKDKLAQAIEQIHNMRDKAAQLRETAAQADGAEAENLETKAEYLLQQAQELSNKVAAKLREHIEQLDAAGKTEQAEKARQQLTELETQ